MCPDPAFESMITSGYPENAIHSVFKYIQLQGVLHIVYIVTQIYRIYFHSVVLGRGVAEM